MEDLPSTISTLMGGTTTSTLAFFFVGAVEGARLLAFSPLSNSFFSSIRGLAAGVPFLDPGSPSFVTVSDLSLPFALPTAKIGCSAAGRLFFLLEFTLEWVGRSVTLAIGELRCSSLPVVEIVDERRGGRAVEGEEKGSSLVDARRFACFLLMESEGVL